MRRFVIGALLLALTVAAPAEDQQWALTDGRTVTVIKVLSQNATHVTVRCPEGILQVDKRQLPESLQAAYPYDEEAAAAKQAEEEREKARAAGGERPVPNARPRPAPQAQPTGGLAIASAQGTERATAVITVANRTAALVEVTREMLVGVNVNGEAFPALRLRNARGDIFVRVKVPAGEAKEITVVFDIPEGVVGDIRAVYWRQR